MILILFNQLLKGHLNGHLRQKRGVCRTYQPPPPGYASEIYEANTIIKLKPTASPCILNGGWIIMRLIVTETRGFLY